MRPSDWFAGILMIVMGAFNAVEGLAALFQYRFHAAHGQLLVSGLTGWGWTHLAIGALAGLAGVLLFSGDWWARLTTVALAILNAVAQLVYVQVQPVWATIVIALCVLVIWAVVRGEETA